MTHQFLCVHGHFYQPPREDPLTGEIPIEAGAAPFPNWNERILTECYRPNAELGNYARMSFNFGPTLLSWLAIRDRETYQNILAQDRTNLQRFGMGNALAQSYNHTILPLASTQDKIIQIAWGIADFQHRFSRAPQGMWLPETAVDLETLSLLARFGIRFTILAPWQAEADPLDTAQPYRVTLPGGEHIAVFFYHGELSARVSFEPGATTNADLFAREIAVGSIASHKMGQGKPRLLLVASDGELYGHHQPFRDRFLSHLLNGASTQAGLQIIYPSLWLQMYPPEQTIRIKENTSWSCHHGIARWRGDCPCTPPPAPAVPASPNSQPAGHWKTHLRRALDRLAAALDGVYFEAIYPLIPQPRRLLQKYIHVILGEIEPEALFAETANRPLTSAETTRVRLLLEAQRERQRMFTSCGWFFADFDRIEPRNLLAYAAHAVRLVQQATGIDLSSEVKEELRKAISPVSALRADEIFAGYLNPSSFRAVSQPDNRISPPRAEYA